MPSRRKPHTRGRLSKAGTESDPDTIYFYMPNAEPYGIFCQWHPSTFTIPTYSLNILTTLAKPPPESSRTTASDILARYPPTITFTCAEQCYMFCKALFFTSWRTCHLVLATEDPKEQKRLGRRIPDSSEYQWDQVKSRVARMTNWYKFTAPQNWGMMRVLLATSEKDLVEAASGDRVWGIGYNEKQAERYRRFWGQNLLGKCLMDVKGKIRKVENLFEDGYVEEWPDWDGELMEEVVGH